jgi:hypothetical protein
MTRENEKAELLLDDTFARFKQSCADVMRTIGTTKLSFSDPATGLSEPPKDISPMLGESGVQARAA